MIYLQWIHYTFFYLTLPWSGINDGCGMPPVRVVSGELVQPCYCPICPDLSYTLLYYVKPKIFDFKIKFFHEIERMTGAKYEIGVPKEGRCKKDGSNNVDRLFTQELPLPRPVCLYRRRGHLQHAKLRSTSSPVWPSVNGRHSMLKALSNDCFSLIPLDDAKAHVLYKKIRWMGMRPISSINDCDLGRPVHSP